ncbi:hypothetical protein [Piscirickettsia salmonis]|uniref:hypothetical protein n=1 Tax=Piscirickettsia salmonis TaxID=1238 RepID=UPI0018ACE7CE|nr:hypothetical protein [Piscirickettsia salmonis]
MGVNSLLGVALHMTEGGINPLNGSIILVISFFGWCVGMAVMPYLTVISKK